MDSLVHSTSIDNSGIINVESKITEAIQISSVNYDNLTITGTSSMIK